MTNIPPISDLLPWQSAQLPPAPFPGYNAFNPSIHIGSDGVWRCTVRCCNYDARGGNYNVRNGTIRTRNVMLTIDPDNGVQSCTEMFEADNLPRFPTHEWGYEDLRLFETKADGLVAVATTAQLRPEAAQEMVLLRLDHNYVIAGAEPIRGEWSRVAQKNWSPYDRADRVELLASIDHCLTIRDWSAEPAEETEPDGRTNKQAPDRNRRQQPLPVIRNNQGWNDPPGLRGGSQLVQMDDGDWLGIGHWMDRARFRASGRKSYQHRFFTTRGRRSPWFTFGQAGIEFCAGMVVQGDRLVLSYGVGDCEAWLGETSARCVEEVLRECT